MLHDDAHRAFVAVMATKQLSLREDLLRLAVRYAHIRAEWWLAKRTGEPTNDKLRGTAHDAFIDACNILSRNMAKQEEDNSWRALLGDDRREIGDFACFVHAFLGVMAREG